MRLLCMDVPSKMVRLGLTQIDLIIQIYYFLCGFRGFCEKLLFLSQTAQKILEIQLICVSQSPFCI